MNLDDAVRYRVMPIGQDGAQCKPLAAERSAWTPWQALNGLTSSSRATCNACGSPRLYGLTRRVPDVMLIRVSFVDKNEDRSFRIPDVFVRDLLSAVSPAACERRLGAA